MIKVIIVFSLLLVTGTAYSQEYKWRVLPNSPTASTRFNDCSFINPNTGWVCNASNNNIWKTTDGGNSWVMCGITNTENRCIIFSDSLNGWTGEYNSANRFNRTTDGGLTWTIVKIPSPASTGMCGFSIVNSNVIYSCGRYWGPARVVKTTDAGNTWQNIDMSGYAAGLVDCKFFTPDSGYAVGRGRLGSDYGIVLFTSDGGASWDTSFVTTGSPKWCWKINFVNANLGYVSLESAITVGYLKTTNRGLTWQELPYGLSYPSVQGIGFINEMTGWAGGGGNIIETTNGGKSWHSHDTAGVGRISNVNRFFTFGDTLVYAMGKRIYKYSRDIPTGTDPNQTLVSNNFKLHQNYPNPFNPKTTIQLDLKEGANIRLTVHDIMGRLVAVIIEGDYMRTGNYKFDWDATGQPSGVYYYTVYNNDIGYSKNMLLVK